MLVTCRDPPFLAVCAFPPRPPGPVAPQCPALSPANNKPSPAADGRKQTSKRTNSLRRQALRVGSIFGSDVTGEASPARDCSPPQLPRPEGALSLALEAARGEGGGAQRWTRALRSTGCTHPAARPPGADLFIPASP